MRLFRRKDEEPVQCPECGERVPESATKCAMCGRDLTDLRGDREDRTARETESAPTR